MLDSNILKQKLFAIDGQDYAAYQSLLGCYEFDLFTLIIQQIPKDPYAPPHTGIYRIQIPRSDNRVISLKIEHKVQESACADFLARRFFDASQQFSKGIRGTGFSGIITINQPGQTILERNSVVITDDIIERRCFLGLPMSEGSEMQLNKAQKYLGIVGKRGEREAELKQVYENIIRRKELFLIAYQNLYANKGALTPGVNPEDTVDGMSLKRIDAIVENLKNKSYKWTPVRRTYIEKNNSKKLRPLGIFS